jgi:hypothetical protein
MAEVAKPTARRPTATELRSRIVAAIGEFIARNDRRDWLGAFSSDQFHLVIDDEYGVSITRRVPAATALLRLSLPLASLGLDPWAVELGGGVRDAALDVLAQAVVRAVDRPGWWVP